MLKAKRNIHVVAVLDEDTDIHYHIVKVINITDSITTLWYTGTRGKHLKSAVWKFIYHIPDNASKCQHVAPQCINPEDLRFTGAIATQDVNTGFIIETNLQTKATNRALE